jgi:F-box/leucine-rich repeat protein 10/11
LKGILTLSEFLVSEARILERGSEQAKKEAKEQIPTDRIKDAPAVARELRWRAKRALGYSSDDEGVRKSKYSPTPVAGSKRRRVDEEEETSQFRNFKPKPWDAMVTTKDDENVSTFRAAKPDGDWTGRWMAGTEGDGEGEEGTVKKGREVVVKVRRTRTGIERQRIERTVEEWTWND